MDLDEEAVRSLRGCSPYRPCEAKEAGLIFISEDPWLVRVMAIPATVCSSKAAPNVPETSGKFRKDVNSDGTNRRSPLESTKVPKNEPKRRPKEAEKCAKSTPRSSNKAKERPQKAGGKEIATAKE